MPLPDRGREGRGLALRRPEPRTSAHPREFTTKSRVVIISNDWQTLNKNVAALQDRGHVLLFHPSASEVHAQAGKWFDDEEIYGWFAANLHRVREPSLRHYVRAKELKAAGMDWTEVLAAEEENPRAGSRPSFWPAPLTPAPRRGSRPSWPRGAGAGRHFSTTSGDFKAARRSKALSASADVSQGTKVTQQHGVHVRDRLQDDQAGARPGFSDFEHPLR